MLKPKLFLSVTTFLIISCSVFAQGEKRLTIGEQPVYKVKKTAGPIIIDGTLDDLSWKNAEVQNFKYFYRREKAPEKQESEFRMMWDNENLYLFYDFRDTSLTSRETNLDGRPYMDDCIEFYCMPVPDSINMHFAFEINIWKKPYDFVILWQYHNGRHVNIKSYNPVYKIEVTYEGTINNDKDKDSGWRMELAIPFTAFSDFNNVNPAKTGTRWAFQAVRQDRNSVDDKGRSTSTIFPIYDIFKDVHQPSRFGICEFTE
jgi:hypothetical protein